MLERIVQAIVGPTFAKPVTAGILIVLAIIMAVALMGFGLDMYRTAGR